jgi:glycosyltransferase involved in cell wall biosynthesis
MGQQFTFQGVTLLITHYNRSSSLERLLNSLAAQNCRFEHIIVSDDCSKPEHVKKIKALQPIYNFELVEGEKNRGFAHNLNKGQDAVKTPYTLYIQEDFVPSDIFPRGMQDALEFMNEDRSLDYIRFWSFYKYPKLKPYKKGFSEIVYSPWGMSHLKFFMYSDNPHLRRSSFMEKFGRYQEGIDGNIAEYRMSISFIQRKGKGLFYDEYDKLFEHKNSPDEPSTFDRPVWRQRKSPLVLLSRWLYLRFKWLKCTCELNFVRY